VEDLDKRHLKNDDYLKNDLIQQKRLITMFLEEAQKRLPEPFTQEQLQTLANEEQHSLDALYVAFEDQFRGSREDILNRFRVYLPIIEEAKIGTPNLPILDVGCGRGEWLELLRESGYTARGIDINRVMLEQCRTRELEVMESDVITYLQSLPDASLGAVTGFHIIEHLPFEVLIKLFDETIRVLSPGGLAIFETPNPENVLVGSHTFYLDPTHRNPLPSAMIKFMAESRGLSRVTTMKLHPYPEEEILDASPLVERFNNYFHGPQDYAVIGYKNG
jgi:O-antigen chain-terminating methyltransferase